MRTLLVAVALSSLVAAAPEPQRIALARVFPGDRWPSSRARRAIRLRSVRRSKMSCNS
jgi:hypothetical protein